MYFQVFFLCKNKQIKPLSKTGLWVSVYMRKVRGMHTNGYHCSIVGMRECVKDEVVLMHIYIVLFHWLHEAWKHGSLCNLKDIKMGKSWNYFKK